MKILALDSKKGIIKVKIEDFNDLYFLKNFIKEGDVVSAWTLRSSLSGEERVRVKLDVKVEKVDLREEGLRVGGLILNEIKNIRRGYHFFTFREGDILTIIKEKISELELNLLEEYCKLRNYPKILVVFIDVLEGNAEFVVLSDFGIVSRESYHYSYSKDPSGKNFEKEVERFLQRVLEIIERKYKELKKFFVCRDLVSEEFLRRRGFDVIRTSATSLSTFLREQRDRILKTVREAYEEKILEEIEKKFLEELVVFGLEDVKKYVEYGAIEKVIISTDLFFEKREEIEELLKKVREFGGEFIFIMSKNCKEKLNAYGGIVGILRYKIKDA